MPSNKPGCLGSLGENRVFQGIGASTKCQSISWREIGQGIYRNKPQEEQIPRDEQ